MTPIDGVTIKKVINIISNQKPWLNREVRPLLRVQDSAFESGDPVALRVSRRELDTAIERAKAFLI